MKMPLSWLNDYTKVGVTPKEYCDAMTLSGSKVDAFEMVGQGIEKVVVGKIEKIEQHPDADKLVVCQVNVGETIQIVTGAKNVFEGAYVPVALHGSHLPDGTVIKKGKLRGVVSEGMMCSTDELGMTEGIATGILILEGQPPLGEDIKKTLGLDEIIVDFDITSNRPDCLSMIGLARESAVTLNEEFSVPEIKVTENNEKIEEYLSVTVEAPKLCPRYTARVVKNIKIEPSPMWMQKRLEGCGVRAINNIVDITNYVMLEYGQPMHAFDIDFLTGHQICVRTAKEGESIVTLDDVERTLTSDMLVICDADHPVAVAGVMGGQNSEIQDTTKTIVFESANFSGASIRSTAKALGMRTEASARYEKELDANITMAAVNRACQLICELGAGEVVGGVIDVCGTLSQPLEITLRPEKINRFLGTNIPAEEMVRILNRLECEVKGDTVYPPTFRKDLETEADLAEEIARFYGYDKIESTLMKGESVAGGKTLKQSTEDLVKRALTARGLYEIYTYSFTDPKAFDKLNIAENSKLRDCVTILNPLGEEQSVMRTQHYNEMLKALSLNNSHRNQNVGLFELGTVYYPKALPVTELPEEREMITIGMYGDVDFYDLKGVVEQLLETLNIQKYKVQAKKDDPTFHPGKTAELIVDEVSAGVFGAVHPAVCRNYELEQEVLMASIDFTLLLDYMEPEKTYHALPKFPAVTRDLAMLCDDEVEVGSIEEIIRQCGKALIEEIKLFDIYKGKQIPQGKKSVAYSVVFRDANKTLEEQEVNRVMDKILTRLEEKLHVELRKN